MTTDLWTDITAYLTRIETGVSECRAEQAAINATLHTLVGNGQPGRIGQIEDNVRAHERFINGVKGVLVVASVLIGAVAAIALHFFI